MDFSKFSDGNFDMKDWINNALEVQPDSTISVDAHASNLVMKLQLFIQEVTKSLEETSQIALNNVPRVLREVETIQVEAKALKNQMISVKGDIEKIEESTAQAMKRLIDVDEIKTRMVNTENALQEAGNWSELRKKVSSCLQSGDLNEVADGLVGMQKSLVVLKDVPDYSDRCTMLENLKNRYEAAISPALVKTFKDQDIERAKNYVEIFSNLGRLSQIERYYNKCHKSSLTVIWNELREDPNKSITKWLPIFFDHLLDLWYKEASWCAQIFPEPVQALASLLIQILNGLQPSIETSLNDAIHELVEPNEVIALLIEVKQTFNKVISSLEKAMLQVPVKDTSAFDHLITVIQLPLQDYLLQYTTLQQAALMKFIDTLKFDSDDLLDTSSAMIDAARSVFKEADQAIDTCVRFTKGVGVAGFVEALQVFFSAYFGLLDRSILEMHEKQENKEGIWKNDDSSNKWRNFQLAFQIIEMCGVLSENMVKFKDHVYVEFMNIKDDLFKQKDCSNYLMVNRPSEWDKVLEFHERISQYNTKVILPSSADNINQLTKHAHQFTFHIIFAHLKEKLNSIQNLNVWHEEGQQAVDGDLPTFSLSPQSYITYVGDSLLTLPEQLEPYFTQENPSLLIALKEGKIPYQKDDQIGAHYNHHWLECFVHGSTEIFAENILKIKRITKFSTRQLLADLEYYYNILAALEIPPTEDLNVIKQLLEVEPRTFQEKVEELSSSRSIVKSISYMRNIPV